MYVLLYLNLSRVYTYSSNVGEDSRFLGGDAVTGLVAEFIFVGQDISVLTQDLGGSVGGYQVRNIGGGDGH